MTDLDTYSSQNIDELVSTLVSNQQSSESVEYFDSPLNSLSPINNVSSNSIYGQQQINASLPDNQMNHRRDDHVFNPMSVLNMSSIPNGHSSLPDYNYPINNNNMMVQLDYWPTIIKSYGSSDAGFNNSNINNTLNNSFSSLPYIHNNGSNNNTIYNNSNYSNLNCNTSQNYINLNCSTNSNYGQRYLQKNSNNINPNRQNGNYINNRRPVYNQSNSNNNQNMDYYVRQRRQIQGQRKNSGFSQLMDVAFKNQNQNQYNSTNNRPSNHIPYNVNCQTEVNNNSSNINRMYSNNQQINQNATYTTLSSYHTGQQQYNKQIHNNNSNNCNQTNNDRVPYLRSIKGQQIKNNAIQKSQINESNINCLIDQLREQYINLDQRVTELLDELNKCKEDCDKSKLLPIDKFTKLSVADLAEIGMELFNKIDKMINDHAQQFDNLDSWLQTSYCSLQCWLNLIQALRFSIQKKLIKLKAGEQGELQQANSLAKSLGIISPIDSPVDDFQYTQLQLLIRSTREVNKSIWCMFVFYKHLNSISDKNEPQFKSDASLPILNS